MNKRISFIIKSLILLFIVAITAYLLWEKRSVFNRQPVLDNRKYAPLLDSVNTVKKRLARENANKELLGAKFVEIISTRIFPYWYGTKWGFYGTTEIPNEGEIACGYFVTTTLRDMGVPIKRIKLAQCASEEMIRALIKPNYIHHFSGSGINAFESSLEKLGNGIYIVGLDNHTGFILVSQSGNYFIHSSGAFPFQVIKEKLSESGILKKSKYKVVGKINSDEAFLRNWVRNTH